MAIHTYLRTALLLGAAVVGLASADACNPLNGPCPAIPGLATSTYSIDFTQQTTTPSDWILADAATVNYGAPNGANFTFAKRYDAPYIWSRFYVLFGRIEVVLKAAPGAGIITGAVMMSDDLDEIDWEWSGNNFAGSNGKVQTNFFGKGITGYYDRGSTPAVNNPQDQFHTYALDWSPDALTWSIDGQNVRTLKNSHATSGEYQFPQTPSRLHLGVWCAGDPGNNGATVAWGGGPTNFSQAPFSAYVKSVKITTSSPCSTWQYPNPFDGTYKSVVCTNQTITNTLPCTYAVAQGDDGYKIATTLGVTLAALKAANPNVNWDTLLVGQSLNVPGGNCTTSSSGSAVPSATSASSDMAAATSSANSAAVPTNSNSATLTSDATSSPSSISSSESASASIMMSGSALTAVASSTMAGSSLSSSSQSAPATVYTVVAGDTGYGIPKKLGCSFDEIFGVNPGLDWDNLLVGQTLNLPSGCTRSLTSSTLLPSSGAPTNPAQPSPSSQSASLTTETTTPPSDTPTSDNLAAASGTLPSAPAAASSSAPSITSGSTITSTCTVVASQSSVDSAATSTQEDSSLSSNSDAAAASSQPPTTKNASSQSSNSDTAAASSQAPATGSVPSTSVSMTSSNTPLSPSSPVPTAAVPSVATSSGQASVVSIPVSHTSASTTDKVNPVTPASAAKLVCNQDNCLRNLIDPRYSSSMLAFCSSYTTTASNTAALPTFLGGCSKDVHRVSSACSCLVSSHAPPTGTPAMATPALRAGTPSWRLKRNPLRWDRVRV
ncbi:60S ribosomal protein L37 [Exophiala dermatitidis]|uniref:60S ribosomal protein L37 n=1 Tax=Exophiala dermatitidis TaxID=5970 RepID=A0AAN6ESV5_EXODE|nr:60S ribosomal protein L37 [Exophiala dermatitidis]KAJ4517697.1 60S ribosomal protein L37 [Exophiala dermatitidis]KAJ4521354.1 60S ribosomal protein L37 [Exophiala dermatitidis]KAJ4542024.1 60S ribosomal protein L37 [Exophiala dermatitidis]KAJ4544791.1 60S ribosomal protein L37 [Exophiala dermatitidis]